MITREKLLDELRGKPIQEKAGIVGKELPYLSAMDMFDELRGMSSFADQCTLIEQVGKAHGLPLEYGDLTILHNEEFPRG